MLCNVRVASIVGKSDCLREPSSGVFLLFFVYFLSFSELSFFPDFSVNFSELRVFFRIFLKNEVRTFLFRFFSSHHYFSGFPGYFFLQIVSISLNFVYSSQ